MAGLLVAVVGPSGAGKDSLIAHAATALANAHTFVFPRRIVSRPPSKSEDNWFAPAETVRWLAAEQCLSLMWEAHGHVYGLPRSIEQSIANNAIVVCNLSRSVLGVATEKFPTRIVGVTAPANVLAARLAARRRASDGPVSQRLERMGDLPADCDDVIINDTTLEVASAEFLAILQAYQRQIVQICDVRKPHRRDKALCHRE